MYYAFGSSLNLWGPDGRILGYPPRISTLPGVHALNNTGDLNMIDFIPVISSCYRQS